jgi:hypothetical protein
MGLGPGQAIPREINDVPGSDPKSLQETALILENLNAFFAGKPLLSPVLSK